MHKMQQDGVKATKMANEPEQTGEESQPHVQLQDVLFSALVTSVCYWATIFLLAIVGTYLIDWRLTHPGPYAAPANDPWGITTPPWLILALAPNRRRRISRTCGLVRLTRAAEMEDAHDGRQSGRRHGLWQGARNLSRADVGRRSGAVLGRA